jgi:alpha-D-xyloside xylohydrolase
MKMQPIRQEGDRLVLKRRELTVWVEPYGPGVIRVRQSVAGAMPERFSALLPPEPGEAAVEVSEEKGSLTSGELRAEVDRDGLVSFRRGPAGSEPFLAEIGKHFATLGSELSRISLDFGAHDDERLYGLGQHAHGHLDQKGCVIDLRQVNTEVAIPVLVSSRGYGFVWHDPATGRVELGRNRTRWAADASRGVDYLVFAGESFAALMKSYARLTGFPPEMPRWAAGFWQSKLRYRNQEELLAVAR